MSVVERMRAERDGLKGRADKLKEYIGGDRFSRLPKDEQVLLSRQLGVMTELVIVLGQRILRAKG